MTVTEAPPPSQMIYADAAPVYREAGWVGVLPLPPRQKASPPSGFTGKGGADPDDDQITRWCNTHAGGNVALRIPDGIIGIDVDQYDKPKPDGTVVQKRGFDELTAIEADLGVALPRTWITTARPSPSGVRWFRVPQGTRFVSELSDSIEILQRHHRYAVVPPSVHPDGESYFSVTPDGERVSCPPPVDGFAWLPPEWVERLQDRSEQPAKREPKPPASPRPILPGSPDRTQAVQRVLDAPRSWTDGSRHPLARDLSAKLARLEDLGHPGATEALDIIGSEFCAAVAGEPGRGEKEWNDLIEGARKLVAETMPTTPEYADIEAEREQRQRERQELRAWEESFRRRSDNGAGRVDGGAAPSTDDDDVLADLAERMTAEERMLPERFWTARPVLEHIRQAAHSRIRSADLVLHGVLARLSAYTPHTIDIPPLAGAVGSLNYFALAIGHSGSGKSSGSSIADELLPRPTDPTVEDRPLGSGEGLAENYMGTQTVDDGGKKVKERRQTIYNVFVYGDEGAALTEMMDRKGTTLSEALRRAWTGSALGQSNATTERTRVIPAGRYRLGLLIGFQPEVAAKLMADDVAGTPQRFVFASAIDPNVPDKADLPDWPGTINVPKIPVSTWREHADQSSGYNRHCMGVHEDIADEIRGDAIARARGQQTDGRLDSHTPLHLLKIAGLLAILDGRLDVNLEDWELARIVWDTSCRVRASVIAAVRAQAEREEAARVEKHAAREHAAEAARGSARSDVDRIARRLAGYVHEDPEAAGRTRGDLRRRLASTERNLADAAISYALEQGWLVEDGTRYVAGEAVA